MMWLNSKALGSHRFFLLKRILLFSILLCFLAAINLSFADEVTDPEPEWEHPWDDMCGTDWNQNPQNPPETGGMLLLQFGFDSWIIFHLQSVGQGNDFGEEKILGPSEKNCGNLLIFVR
jgi:hypothetical protein